MKYNFNKKELSIIIDMMQKLSIQDLKHESCADKIIDSINDCISHKKFNDDTFKNQINSLHKRLDEYYRHTGDEYIQNMLYDISGQVKEALNMTSDGEREDWFSRWGIHYLRSLQEAYKKEMCNNF